MTKILKKPKIVIRVIILLTIFFIMQLPSLKINNDLEVFLPDGNPVKVTNDKIDKIFGSSDVISVALKSNGSTILTADNLEKIKQLTAELEYIKNVDQVNSMTNADYIEGTAEGMAVSDLVPGEVRTKKDLLEIKEKLFSWQDMYQETFYSKDLKSTMLNIKLISGISVEEQKDVFYAIQDTLKKNKTNNFQYYIAGAPAVTILLEESTKRDLAMLIPFVILVVLASLYISFKKIGGVILPLLVVLISVIWTMGLMAILHIQLTILATVIPVLLIAVGSAYGIHIISHYYDELVAKGTQLGEGEHHLLISIILEKVGRPVFWAGITTMVGFGSLVTSKIVPMKQFGIFTAVGTVIAVSMACLLIPAILLIRHKNLQYSKSEAINQDSILNKVILAIYHYFAKNQIRLLIFTLLIVLIFGYGATKINVGTNMINMFKADTEVRKADNFVNKNFGGSNVLSVLISGDEKGSLTNPEILKDMDELKNYLVHKYDSVGKVTSFADLLKRMNKVMHYPEEDTQRNVNSSVELETGQIGQESSNNFEETSSSFAEGTFNFGEETSDFSWGADADSVGESISSFGVEETSNFSGEETQTTETNKEIAIEGPSSKKMSEKELVILLNEVIAKAQQMNLSGDELVKAVNRELNYRGEAYNEIPYNPEKYPAEDREELKNLISQYLILYSGSLDDLIDDQLEPAKALMTIQLKNGNSQFVEEIMGDIKNYANENFPESYQIQIAGNAAINFSITDLIMETQFKSILLSLIVVFMIVAFDYKSIIAGFYGIVVSGISLIINFGIMGFAGIDLNVATAMISSIAIGIGIDYVIHFLSAYHHERQLTDDLEVVNKKTLLSTGKAIIFNALAVALGFAVMLFSNFVPMKQFGMLIAIIMITSATAALTILPALLNIFKPKFIRK